MPLSASGARGIRLWDVIRPNQGGDTTESRPRCNRVWDVKRLRLLPRSLTSWDSVFSRRRLGKGGFGLPIGNPGNGGGANNADEKTTMTKSLQLSNGVERARNGF